MKNIKALLLFAICLLLVGTPVSAHEHGDVPNVVGMREHDAKNTLDSYVMPNGEKAEVIVNYEYHADIVEGEIIRQEVKDPEKHGDKTRIVICVSMGKEPNEHLGDHDHDKDNNEGFGITDYVPNDSIGSQFGIDWSSLPDSYEYNWDNSANCWDHGVWIDGKQYKTERGKFNTNVRHKVQGYCDGTYVYIRIVMARDFGDRCNGDNYQFWLDGELASFALRTMDGHNLTGKYPDVEVGTHQIEVRHEGSAISGTVVVDALAYITKFEHRHNAVLEMRIPLSEMQRQNSRIDLEHLGVIEFFCPNLMYRRFRIAGASTFPLVLAATALVAVPGSTVLIRKYRKKKI